MVYIGAVVLYHVANSTTSTLHIPQPLKPECYDITLYHSILTGRVK